MIGNVEILENHCFNNCINSIQSGSSAVKGDSYCIIKSGDGGVMKTRRLRNYIGLKALKGHIMKFFQAKLVMQFMVMQFMNSS